MNMSKEPSEAEKMIGDFAPTLVNLTDRVLLGEVWERRELSKRDRSLATVAALIAFDRPEQLRFHLRRALENGLTKEVITRLAFYSGWPNAMSAIMVAKEVFSKT
jgi:4-carboxymuconolactone decarboxylase